MRPLALPVVLLAASSAAAAPAPFEKPERPDRVEELRPFQGRWDHGSWQGRRGAEDWLMVGVRAVIDGRRITYYYSSERLPDRDATIRLEGKGRLTLVTSQGMRAGVYRF